MEKSTEDLQSELTQAQSYDEFYNKNTSEIKFPSAVDYLNYLLDLKGITNKADFIKKTNLERTYVYHILNGNKNPGRDKLIILALAAQANITETQNLLITETQNLLKYAGERPLYVRDRRDGLIFYAIEHGKNLDAVNILLDENNLEILK